jgi:hypothetical protein
MKEDIDHFHLPSVCKLLRDVLLENILSFRMVSQTIDLFSPAVFAASYIHYIRLNNLFRSSTD